MTPKKETSFGSIGSSQLPLACPPPLPRDALIRLPKVELHAHFFGCIKPSTIRKIAACKAAESSGQQSNGFANASSSSSSCEQENKPDLNSAFTYFNWVYSVVKSKQDMRQALAEVLEDFHKDNVVYLELRSSLKRIPEENVDPQSYVDLLVEGCREAERRWGMTVRLIVSLDRSKMTDEEAASFQIEEAFEAARRYPDWIVGFDIAGRPDKGNIDSTLQRLQKEVMRPGGRFFGSKKLTVHTAEVQEDGGDAQKILSLMPHRLGHGLYLTEKQQTAAIEKGAFVEVCPTSNMCTIALKNMKEHPLKAHFERDVSLSHVCICTDDTGLFQTSLSRELEIVAEAFNLSGGDIFALQRNAMRAAFCREEEKKKINDLFFNDSCREEFLQSFAA